jgi:GT2 family glycosyltransferase
MTLHNGHGNIGYGRANNLVIHQTQEKYHLILNPDVMLAVDCLAQGISYLEANENVGLIAPSVKNQLGETEYLAKRMPSVLVIFLRGINNSFLNSLFQSKLDHYAYKDLIPTSQPLEIELASGCFMLCKSHALKAIGGFSENYFLYFEDFDLSVRLKNIFKIMYIPSVQIIHLGGNTSKKGLSHTIYFLKSAMKFLCRW